mgnify:CR=1 FL=1
MDLSGFLSLFWVFFYFSLTLSGVLSMSESFYGRSGSSNRSGYTLGGTTMRDFLLCELATEMFPEAFLVRTRVRLPFGSMYGVCTSRPVEEPADLYLIMGRVATDEVLVKFYY